MKAYLSIISCILGVVLPWQTYAAVQEATLPGSREYVDSLNQQALETELSRPDTSFVLAFRALEQARELNYTEGVGDAYLNIARLYNSNKKYNWDSVQFYLNLAVDLYGGKNDSLKIAEAYFDMCFSCYQYDNYAMAIEYCEQAKRIFQNANQLLNYARVLSLMCEVHNYMGSNELATKLGIESLRILDELEVHDEKARLLQTLGSIHFDLQSFNKAKRYFNQSMELARKHELNATLSSVHISLGEVALERREYDTAMYYFNEALAIDQANNDVSGTAYSYYNIGKTYTLVGENEKAINQLQTGLDIAEQYSNLMLRTRILLEFGRAYYNMESYEKAIDYLKQSLEQAQRINSLALLRDCYLTLAKYYDKMGDLENALIHFKLFSLLKDRMYREESTKRITEIETMYELDKKEQQISLLKKENRIQLLEAKDRNFTIVSLFFFLILTGIVLGVMFSKYRLKNRKNVELEMQRDAIDQQKRKIELQRDEIISKSEEINLKNRDITDSIIYAQRIQLSVLPDQEELKDIFPDSFVFYKPKAIVSGDCYWVHRTGSRVIFAALDCTGHGVPGAFMTILANSILNQLVIENKATSPNVILHLMDKRIREALHQRNGYNREEAMNDGLDMAVCFIDLDTLEVQFSGAQMSVYYGCPEGGFHELRGTRYSLGGTQFDQKSFTNETLHLHRGSMIYFASDGFQDQFGGEKDKKFMKARFREMLQSLTQHATAQQYRCLESAFEEWRGEQEQTDDVMVVGVRFS